MFNRTRPCLSALLHWAVIMQVVHPHCCGLDVHKKAVKACELLTHPDGNVTSQVRTFSTMTDGLLALADWLRGHAVTDVAMESAGVVLAGNDPRAVLSMLDLSRASYRKMWQNLIWATGYNIISVPLAAGVLAFAGVVLSPAAGAVLMSVSTIVVALNAQLLRRLKLNPTQVR